MAEYEGLIPGVGLDLGTMNVVSARRTSEGVVTTRMRDAFIDFPREHRKMLRLSNVNYVERGDRLVIVGDAAYNMANMFGTEVRRPLQSGLVSAGEIDALEILGVIIRHVLGDPVEEREVCCFSVPAAPVDDPSRDVVYHRGVLQRIIEECGYRAVPGNEAMAIVYSECAKEGFSGLALSYGAGMTNIALAINTVEGFTASVGRCLAGDFPVVTKHGLATMENLREGDEVLDAHGNFVAVTEKLENGHRDSLVEVVLENLPGFPHRLTHDHRVFVRRRFGWEWVEAGSLREGDDVGVPTILSARDSGSGYSFGNQICVAGARSLGRLFGMFLGDGSCGPHAEDPSHVQIAVNCRDQHLVEAYADICFRLFHREVEIVDDPAENLTRIKLHITPVARHFKERFYDEHGVKTCPLDPSKIGNQMALGIVQGLLDSDSHEEAKRHTITNTSLPVVMLAHHLLNRFGVGHSIVKREPRVGGLNSRGVRIEGRKPCYEIKICGHVAKNLLDTMIACEGTQVFDDFPDFVTYRVRSVNVVEYGSKVYDIRVASSHHSFSSPGMIVHNCGDWIDAGAARSVGSTQARMCAIKEKGLDLLRPSDREQEALVVYYKNLIEYTLDTIAIEFEKIRSRFALPQAIPIVVSGGTSKAAGFLEFFKKVFEEKRKRYPIEVSEIRAARDPLEAVARGLLVQALQEYDEE
jgi:hypothetical protein